MVLDPNGTRTRSLTQFSLRSLLIVMLLGAAFGAGWIAHREWNRQHLSETISGAMQAEDIPVNVEFLEGPEIIITRGRKEDVEQAMPLLDEVKQAAEE